MKPITFKNKDGREITTIEGNPDQVGSWICKNILGFDRSEDGWTDVEFGIVAKKLYDEGWIQQ
jgi:hypothetical protein